MRTRFPSLLHLLFRLLMLLATPALLAGCGDLPEPFLGNPGATARRLAVPETPMLAVPPPSRALLPAQAGEDYAQLLALSLQKEEVPSLARVQRKSDWALAVSASRKGDQVVPRYGILDPTGRELGSIDGAGWPAAGWISGAPWTLGQAAQDAVPKVLALMMSIQATRDRANPDSLMNRPARLFVPAVTGAPGDGDISLTKLIRAQLAAFGPLVQTTPEGTDFTVQGTVTVSPLPRAQQQVEIAWTVTRPSGVLVGKVSQLNAIAVGSLDEFWGDVAVVVAQEASGGINTVVERFIGRDKPVQGTTTGAGGGAGPGATAAPGTQSTSAVATAPGAAAVLGVATTEPGKATAPSGATAAGAAMVPGAATAPGKATAGGKAAPPGAATAASKATASGTPTAASKATASGKATAPGRATAPVRPTPAGAGPAAGAKKPATDSR